MKKIQLLNKKYVLVDDLDFNLVNQYKWYLNRLKLRKYEKTHYAVAVINNKTILMHRLIMNPPADYMIDHINGNGLDNRRDNLRICTNQYNQYYAKTRKRGLSNYRGVSRNIANSKQWQAKIGVNKKVVYLGSFNTEEEAHKAYLIAYKQIIHSL